MQDPPPPPRALTDVTGVVSVGTAVWFLVWAGFLVAHLVADRPLDIWFTSTLVGWLLGLLGLSIFAWQRRAARRGSRLAQRGLD
ncbi:DUF2530 domain-containing protein [Pseudonocardia spinosispora]|uniref:DUF2530 domain-containing protein n=1 Tax=Pseudonocardia spinosispora TaxID=103441 RepID=UPI0003FADA39|nr:DUF2530 domain-containing protein [Pseudonocardia spinosispora]